MPFLYYKALLKWVTLVVGYVLALTVLISSLTLIFVCSLNCSLGKHEILKQINCLKHIHELRIEWNDWICIFHLSPSLEIHHAIWEFYWKFHWYLGAFYEWTIILCLFSTLQNYKTNKTYCTWPILLCENGPLGLPTLGAENSSTYQYSSYMSLTSYHWCK